MSNLETAVRLCRAIEGFAPRSNCHVGLTGGTLYKNGSRQDIDILFYPANGNATVINKEQLLDDLQSILGIEIEAHYGRIVKTFWQGISVDMFFFDCEDFSGPDGGSPSRQGSGGQV